MSINPSNPCTCMVYLPALTIYLSQMYGLYTIHIDPMWAMSSFPPEGDAATPLVGPVWSNSGSNGKSSKNRFASKTNWWFRNPAITSWGEGSWNPICYRVFLNLQTVVGLGISEPSTVCQPIYGLVVEVVVFFDQCNYLNELPVPKISPLSAERWVTAGWWQSQTRDSKYTPESKHRT